MKKTRFEHKVLECLEKSTRRKALAEMGPANPWPTCPSIFHQPKRPSKQ